MYSRIFSFAGTPRSASSRSAASSLLASQSRNSATSAGCSVLAEADQNIDGL